MSASPRVLADDPEVSWENAMQFRLTYEGPLRATQRDSRPGQPSRHIQNKRDIRDAFHAQLKKLWGESSALNGVGKVQYIVEDFDYKEPPTSIEELSKVHAHYGFNFVPLVTEDLDLLCSIDVLLLRPDRPGGLIWAGDIDNRLKTLLDALRVPEPSDRYSDIAPTPDQSPYFVLLEDDKLVTRVAVDTDRMLQSVSGDDADVRLVLDVSIKPFSPSIWNAHFG